MNKFELIKQIQENDIYKDDISVISYNSKGELTNNVRIVTTYGPNGTRLAIIGED